MIGLEKIIARLEADAQADVDAVAAEARTRCDAVLAEYSAKADAEYAARIEAGRKSCVLREERHASAAEMEARKRFLAFKQELVSDVFAAAVERIAALPRAEYVAFLASLAVKAATSGAEELIFNAKDAKEVGRDVAKAANTQLGRNGHLTVSGETREIPGGVIVKQGDIEVNCAIDTLVQLRRGDLASQVAEILFN